MTLAPASRSSAIPHCRFRDVRLNHRSDQFFQAMACHPDATLAQLATSRAEEAAYSRFLNNPAVQIDFLIAGITEDIHQRLIEQSYDHVLIVSDTSEVNLHHYAGHHHGHGLGVTGNNVDWGFFVHQGIAVDPRNGQLLGCVALDVWTRKGGFRDRSDLESQKWFDVVSAVEASTQPLARQLTFINDREGDIFAFWQRIQNGEHHFLTRARQDRRIAISETCPSGKLFADLAHQPLSAIFELDIPADRKTQRTARHSDMELRWVTVELLQPKMARSQAARVRVQALEVRECFRCVPVGQKPLVWRILTTHSIDTVQDALQIIEWYVYRWRVEDVFSALKTRGIDIERSPLHRGSALIKLGVMALWSATRLTALVKGRDDGVTHASQFFQEEELDCMEALLPALEGKTTKQSNLYPRHSLAWAVWILSRLGRWHGSGVPGTTTIRRGLERFEAAFLGWDIQRRI